MATVESSLPIAIEYPPVSNCGAGGRRLFTVDEYALMGETGVLKPDERTELIGGEVRPMNAMGPMHAEVVRRLTLQLIRQADDLAIVSPQCPFVLDDYSQPEPDLALLQNRSTEYVKSHPRANDVLLLIEVSDTSLLFDRDEKMPRYAAAHIREVWIVDVQLQQIEQYSAPNQGTFERKEVRKIDDEIQSLGTPKIVIQVMSLFR